MSQQSKRKIESNDDQQSLLPSSNKSMKPQPELDGVLSELSAIERLPTEILVKIFRYVSIGQWTSMERVSTRFRESMLETWKTLEKIRIFDDLLASSKYFPNNSVGEQVLRSVLEKLSTSAVNLLEIGGFPETVNRQVDESNQNDFIGQYLTRFEKLRRIERNQGDSLTLNDVATLLANSSNRHRFTDLIAIGSKTAPSYRRFVDAFRNVDNGTKQSLRLATINLENHENRLVHWREASVSFAFLRTMDISRLVEFRISGTYVPRRKLRDFIERAANLRSISFDFTCICEEEFHLLRRHGNANVPIETVREENEAILKAIGTQLTNLESLTIGSSYGASADCPCRDIPHAMAGLFRVLGERRREEDGSRIFKELALFGFAAQRQYVSSIADHLQDLDSLTLETRHLEKDTLERVLLSQRRLRSLRLKSTRVTQFDISIDKILGNVSTLETLSIDFPHGNCLGGDFRLLANFHQLKTLKIIDNPRRHTTIDDAVLWSWASSSDFGINLRSLELGCFSAITARGLEQFLAKTSRLESLRIGNIKIDEEFLGGLPAKCPLIRELHLHGCYGVTVRGCQAIVDGCAQLKIVSFPDHIYSSETLSLPKYRRIRFEKVL